MNKNTEIISEIVGNSIINLQELGHLNDIKIIESMNELNDFDLFSIC